MQIQTTIRHLAGWALLAVVGVSTPLMGQETEITVTGVAATEGGVEILLSDLVDSGSVSAFVLEEPARVVVDIVGVAMGDAPTSIDGEGLVRRIELSDFAEDDARIVRVSIQLTEAASHELSVEDDRVFVALVAGGAEDSLLAALGETTTTEEGKTLDHTKGVSEGPGTPSGPKKVSGLALASLDFIDGDTVSRVVLATTQSVDYVSSQPEPNLVVLDIPGATVPRSLQRVLDTSRFVAPVRMVRAYATRGGARVAVSLRENTPWSVSAGSGSDSGSGSVLHIDFNVSDEMQATRKLAAQSFSEVAPSDSSTSGGEGLEGAYTSETLIGEAGRTMDPQAVFGTGRGADSPASLLGGSSGFTFDSGTASQSQWQGRRINIDLVQADIHSVFRLISHVSKLNIVSGDDVSGTVTVRLVDVPWDQAFSAILQAKSLAAQRFGNIVRVAPIETIKTEQQAALEAMRAREELTPLQILILPLNYAKADEVKEQIEPLLSARGSIEVDTRANQIIIKETEERLAQIRELIRSLDKATPQVLIEARIVEANSRYSRSLGIQWGGELNASAATGYTTGLFFPSSVGVSGGVDQSGAGTGIFYSPGSDNLAVDLPSDGSTGSLAFALGSVPGLVNIDARLTAMETDGWGEIVSSPRILTLDNTSATIKQGARVPFLSTSAGGTQVQFVQAALELSVTPHITSDDKIFMEINIENNRPDFSTVIQGQPGIQIKEAQTELLVSNGDTTVIGGVFSTEQGKSINRVPVLGKIPLLGKLFQSQTRTTSRNEMLVFVTPRIVTEAVSSN